MPGFFDQYTSHEVALGTTEAIEQEMVTWPCPATTVKTGFVVSTGGGGGGGGVMVPPVAPPPPPPPVQPANTSTAKTIITATTKLIFLMVSSFWIRFFCPKWAFLAIFKVLFVKLVNFLG